MLILTRHKQLISSASATKIPDDWNQALGRLYSEGVFGTPCGSTADSTHPDAHPL